MIPHQFSTQRLSVSHWKDHLAEPHLRRKLADDLAALLTPAVLKNLPPPMQLRDRDISAWIEARHAESDILLVRQSSDNKLIGLMVLAVDLDGDAPPSVHIGYLIAEIAWGNGYASELLKGLQTAVLSGPAMRLVAGVGRDNPASARVLQKAGFKLWTERCSATTEMYVCDVG